MYNNINFNNEPNKLIIENKNNNNSNKNSPVNKIKIDKEINYRNSYIKLNNSTEYKYFLECYDGVPKCPLQLLIFKLVKLCREKSLLIFRHEFKQPVKPNLIKNIEIKKKNILLNLKKSLINCTSFN